MSHNALVPMYKSGKILLCNSFKDYKKVRLLENAVIDTAYVYYTEKTKKKSVGRMFLTWKILHLRYSILFLNRPYLLIMHTTPEFSSDMLSDPSILVPNCWQTVHITKFAQLKD